MSRLISCSFYWLSVQDRDNTNIQHKMSPASIVGKHNISWLSIHILPRKEGSLLPEGCQVSTDLCVVLSIPNSLRWLCLTILSPWEAHPTAWSPSRSLGCPVSTNIYITDFNFTSLNLNAKLHHLSTNLQLKSNYNHMDIKSREQS